MSDVGDYFSADYLAGRASYDDTFCQLISNLNLLPVSNLIFKRKKNLQVQESESLQGLKEKIFSFRKQDKGCKFFRDQKAVLPSTNLIFALVVVNSRI